MMIAKKHGHLLQWMTTLKRLLKADSSSPVAETETWLGWDGWVNIEQTPCIRRPAS